MSHRFSSGEVLVNRYEIKDFHAAGSMQEVYISYDLSLDRIVAIKTPKDGVRDRRFRRGAEMGARVNHPNIAATFDYFSDDNFTFLVEEFIDGKDLGELLEKEFIFFDPFLAAHVVHHIARALAEAHRVNICHRDLKPSNIMVSTDPSLTTIKLTDFGIAKLAQGELEHELELFGKDEATLTTSNTLLGAIPYLAPECWSDWKSAGLPMDLWALGCISFQLLSGTTPFGIGRLAIANVTKAELAGQVSLTKPAWFGLHPGTKVLEEGLWEIIQGCLRISPDARLTAIQVLEAFDSLTYANAERRLGTIQNFRVTYAGGGSGAFGFIDDSKLAGSWFFHGSDYFGPSKPTANQRVSYCIYPGIPKPRAAPVLALRDLPNA